LWKWLDIVHSEITGAAERSQSSIVIYTGMRATLTMEDTDQGRAATLTRSGTYAIPRVCS
ncbi:MAG: hypothetical protein QXW72_05005, partial [Conexivisphaerales archaeon]